MCKCCFFSSRVDGAHLHKHCHVIEKSSVTQVNILVAGTAVKISKLLFSNILVLWSTYSIYALTMNNPQTWYLMTLFILALLVTHLVYKYKMGLFQLEEMNVFCLCTWPDLSCFCPSYVIACAAGLSLYRAGLLYLSSFSIRHILWGSYNERSFPLAQLPAI